MEQPPHPQPKDPEDEVRQALIRQLKIEYIMSVNQHRIARLSAEKAAQPAPSEAQPTKTLKVDVPSV
jgi:hypothetical protein